LFDPVQLAKASVYGYLTSGSTLAVPSETPAEWLRPGGAFVCLKIDGELRGCIGTFAPTRDSLAEEIICNAISSATRDYRFEPLTLSEFPSVDFSVDVLEPPGPVQSLDELDPKVYGVIVRAGSRQGLLLPDLEGVDSVEDQIAIACRKAGIAPGEPLEVSKFRVTRYI